MGEPGISHRDSAWLVMRGRIVGPVDSRIHGAITVVIRSHVLYPSLSISVRPHSC
jgi:hypothetical protein